MEYALVEQTTLLFFLVGLLSGIIVGAWGRA